MMQMHKMPDGKMMPGKMTKEMEGNMPMKEGMGNAAHAANVSELMKKYKKTGKMGSSRPKNKMHAERMANAIAYSKAGAKK